jgi:hypothetical protein
MPVDEFVDKIIHRSHTGGTQAVGNLVSEENERKRLIRKIFSNGPRDSQAL